MTTAASGHTDALAERLFAGTIGALEVASIHIDDYRTGGRCRTSSAGRAFGR